MENIFVEFLPPWVETGIQPAFYDKESGTVLQQTARMYARVNMLIRMFNKLSKETKETVEEYITKFNELHDYVHDYFDNLDVQEEINNKLDAMVEAGTLQEIIAEYLDANVAWTFDTVADMKLASNLVDGSYARTLGFHSINDGGGATYYITDSGTADEMQTIAVGDLYANLVLPAVVNPEIFGAYGDETHDDTDAIQKAINSNHPVVMGKKYLITPIYIGNQDPSITRGWKENISIDASSAKFTYTGGNSAFVLAGIRGGRIKFGTITATNGSCIEMWSTNGNVHIAYLTLDFNELNAGEKALYIHPTTGSSGTGFINEITVNGGTINSGDYGIYVESLNETSGATSGHCYNKVAFEGCDVNFYGKVTHGDLKGFTFNDIRYVENDSAPMFVLDGNILNFNVNSWGRLYPSRLNLTNATVSQFSIKAPIALAQNTGTIGSGLYIDGSHMTYLNEQYSSKTLTNAEGASGSTVITNQNNQLALNFVGVYGASASQTLVTASNSPCKPIRRVYTTLTSANGSVLGRASIETDGEIKLSCATVGTALYGSLSFISDDIKKF
jgi:hypothetical protein